mgnify:CR=1 FL=1
MILTIYDNFGKILTSIRQNVELNSYELAISKFLKENQKHITSGMAELEILSLKKENILLVEEHQNVLILKKIFMNFLKIIRMIVILFHGELKF